MPLTLLDNFTIVISALRVIPSKISPCADIAQLVEQRIRNAKVVGSTPIIGTISKSPQIYRNQLKARMLRFLAGIISCYQLDSTGIKLPVGGISGGILCSVQ